MKRRVYQKYVFPLVATVCWLAKRLILQVAGANYHPIPFTQPLSAGRGTLTPVDGRGYYLNREEMCKFLVEFNGFPPDQCSGDDMILFKPFPGVAWVGFYAPSDEGRVSYDGWGSEDSEKMESLLNSLTETLLEQGEALGQHFESTGWKIYPTLDKQRNVLYFAHGMILNGAEVVSVKFILFDRYGTVTGSVTPEIGNPSTEELEDTLYKTLAIYRPLAGNSYAEWQAGDKVAARGVVGFLDSLLGIQKE